MTLPACPGPPPGPDAQGAEHEAFFARNGFTVVRGCLSPAEVQEMRRVLEADRAAHEREHWQIFGQSCDGGPIGESGRWQSSDMLSRTEVFDRCVAHPVVAPLLDQLMGESICLYGGGPMIRDPVLHQQPPRPGQEWPPGTGAAAPAWPEGSNILWQMWHREQGGTGLSSHRLCIPTLQVRWQLDDTTPTSHCISIVPESVEEKRRLAREPRLTPDGHLSGLEQIVEPFITEMWRNRHMERGVDVLAHSGDVIIMNNSNIHAGTVRATDRPRRDFTFQYGHKGLSRPSRWVGPSPADEAARIFRQRPRLHDTAPAVKSVPADWLLKEISDCGGGVSLSGEQAAQVVASGYTLVAGSARL